MISCDTKYLPKMYSAANNDEGGVISSVIDNLAPVVANVAHVGICDHLADNNKFLTPY